MANSPLLRRVLADACSPAATGAASAALILLDEAAARDNNHLALFRSRERFPEVMGGGGGPWPDGVLGVGALTSIQHVGVERNFLEAWSWQVCAHGFGYLLRSGPKLHMLVAIPPCLISPI